MARNKRKKRGRKPRHGKIRDSERIKYFAYGSNMNIDRIQERVGNVTNLGQFVLNGWKVKFNAINGDNSYANLVHTNFISDNAIGIVYEMTYKQLKQLDTYEALYTKIRIFDMITYMCIWPQKEKLPTANYVYHINKGLKDNKINLTYKAR